MGQIKEPEAVAYEECCHLERFVADGIHKVHVIGANVVWVLFRKKLCSETRTVTHVGVLELQLPLETVEQNIRQTRDAISLERERFLIPNRYMMDS